MVAEIPRIPPLPEDEWDDLLKATASAIGPLNVITTLGRHPELFKAWLELGSMLLLKGTLSARDRELGILRAAHNTGCVYEWTHHVRLALEAGLTEEEVAAAATDLDAHPWNDADRMVLAAADELHTKSTLSDETWAALSTRFGEGELTELVMLIGHYHMLAFALNSLRVQLEDGH